MCCATSSRGSPPPPRRTTTTRWPISTSRTTTRAATPPRRAARRCCSASASRSRSRKQPVATFSGGWRMRLQLAQALMAPSDLLLLDEPTNHLDLDAIVWLEQWLRRYPGTAIVISHDREFLDAVCERHARARAIAGWSAGAATTPRTSCSAPSGCGRRRARTRSSSATSSHLQSFVDRFKAKATKAKQAQSRVKAMERMTLLAPVIDASPFTFRFRAPRSSPDPMLVVDALDCGYRLDDGDVARRRPRRRPADRVRRADRPARRERPGQVDRRQDARRHARAARAAR